MRGRRPVALRSSSSLALGAVVALVTGCLGMPSDEPPAVDLPQQGPVLAAADQQAPVRGDRDAARALARVAAQALEHAAVFGYHDAASLTDELLNRECHIAVIYSGGNYIVGVVRYRKRDSPAL